MATEQIGFMRSLCMGVIEEEVIFPYPKMKAAESELLSGIFDTIKGWLKGYEKDFRTWDREGELPEKVLQEIREMGLFGLVVPEAAGGLGLSTTGYSRMLQELGKYDGSLAITVGAHSSIGMKGLVLFGTEAQKAKYLPKLTTGEMIAAFCLTEAGAGSDAASIKTKAVKEGDHWVITGEKLWITNGGIASFFTVFARTDSGESAGGKESTHGKTTAFIVTKDMAGVSCGPHEDKMGLRASSTTTVILDKVRVPVENVLGGEGQGFKVAMQILNSGRSGLGGGCVGMMKEIIALSAKQANQRVQFGKPIATYGLIKQKIGHMVVECYVTESVVSMISGLVDAGSKDYAVEAAISKVFASEALWRTVDEGLQIAGGNGFMREFPYERVLRDSRVNRIFEGTNDILRLFIALTAMNDVGKQLKELSSSLEGIFQDPIKGFGVLSDYGRKRISSATGLGKAKGTLTKVHPRLRDQAQIFEDGVRDLSAAADRILRKHGKNIIGKQFAIKRLADIMIDLFILACVLSRVTTSLNDKGSNVEKEIEILNVFAGQVRRRTKSNFNKIDDNDDELIKSLADHALTQEAYVWDTL